MHGFPGAHGERVPGHMGCAGHICPGAFVVPFVVAFSALPPPPTAFRMSPTTSETKKDTTMVTTTTITMSLGSMAPFGGGGGDTSEASSSSDPMRLAVNDAGNLNAILAAGLLQQRC